MNRAITRMGEYFAENSADYRGMVNSSKSMAVSGSDFFIAKYYRSNA
jgi:hypothetical protein